MEVSNYKHQKLTTLILFKENAFPTFVRKAFSISLNGDNNQSEYP